MADCPCFSHIDLGTPGNFTLAHCKAKISVICEAFKVVRRFIRNNPAFVVSHNTWRLTWLIGIRQSIMSAARRQWPLVWFVRCMICSPTCGECESTHQSFLG